ncbi:Transmembrane protein 266 [Apodemus speciosus]|uniref:Transmembrane protein 266 n=1 Tax=Apodemus speciosus TaxID=105296 RepID=A0ABQ0F561_APOSI
MRPATEGGISEVEIISQQVDEETKSIAPVQLVNLAYLDLPLAAVDLSTGGSQLLSNLDEEYQREGSNWLKPCCGKRAAVWQTVLRIVVLGIWDYIENKIEVFDGAVIILSLAPMVASTVANGPRSPWDAISLIIMLRIWRVKRVIDAYVLPVKLEMEMVTQQYEKAKAIQDEQLERLTQICQEQGATTRCLGACHTLTEVCDSSVCNRLLIFIVTNNGEGNGDKHWIPSQQQMALRAGRPVQTALTERSQIIATALDAIELLATVHIDQVAARFEIRQLRAHLAQQDLDLAAEREAALQAPHVLSQPRSRYKVLEAGTWAEETAAESIVEELRPSQEATVKDDMNSYISQYYNGPSSDSGAPELAVCVITTAAIDIHQPSTASDLFSVDLPLKLSGNSTCTSATLETTSHSTCGSVTRAQSASSQTLGSSTDCSTPREELSSKPRSSPLPLLLPPQQPVAEATVQDLMSSLSEDPCPSHKALDPAPLAQPTPVGSVQTSPELEHRVSLFNQKNQEALPVLQIKPVIHLQSTAGLEEKYRSLESKEPKLHSVPEA